MPLLEILTIIIGIVYGYVKPGKEDRFGIFKKGIVIGVTLGVIFVILGMFTGIEFLLMSGIVGSIAIVYIILITILFIVGTYIGDWLEEKTKCNDSRYDRPWK